MVTAPTPGPIDGSYVTELLEVALSILQRHHDRDLAQKTLALLKIFETSKRRPDMDNREALSEALADLTDEVQSNLNAELDAVASLWAPYITDQPRTH